MAESGGIQKQGWTAVEAERESHSFFVHYTHISHYFSLHPSLPTTLLNSATHLCFCFHVISTHMILVSFSERSDYGDIKEVRTIHYRPVRNKKVRQKSATETSRLKVILMRQERNNPRDGGSYVNTQRVLCDHLECPLS